MENKLNKIAVFGPHDRINYGDFLFPLMLEHSFSKFANQPISLKKYSLVSSDFSTIGAFSSNNYKQFVSDIENKKIDSIIVAGGESLQAMWSNLYSYISPLYDYFFQKESFRKNRIFKNIPKYILGGKSEFPFILNKQDFNTPIDIYYNAVGGGKGMPQNSLHRLSSANMIGLREKESFDYIKHNINHATLVPDSAIIISDVYKKEIDLHQLHNKKYIFLQVAKPKHQNKIKEICEQLTYITENTDLDIILCPIGTAKGHEDHIPLKEIKNHLNNNDKIIFFKEQPTIKEIASLIAYSQLYIGTSLHGIITSLSYGTPFIGLNPRQIKLVSYIKTWGGESINLGVYNTDSFLQKALDILDKREELSNKILENTQQQKEAYYNFAKNIFDNIIK